MSFEHRSFVALRPCVYHVTARHNLDRLQRTRTLYSAGHLLRAAGTTSGRTPRKEHVRIAMEGEPVMLRDQARLTAANIAFDGGWDIARLIEHLDGFVFFWPGSDQGIGTTGLGFFDRYDSVGEHLAVLRVPTQALFADNPTPRFSGCNWGAPRMNAGAKQPRGGETFLTAGAFRGTPGKVTELVFEHQATLPASTQWGTTPTGPWQAL